MFIECQVILFKEIDDTKANHWNYCGIWSYAAFSRHLPPWNSFLLPVEFARQDPHSLCGPGNKLPSHHPHDRVHGKSINYTSLTPDCFRDRHVPKWVQSHGILRIFQELPEKRYSTTSEITNTRG